MSDFVISSSGLRAEVRQEVRDDLRVTVPRRLQRRVGLAVHGPPLSEARNRALPAVHAGADVEFDFVGPPLGGLPVREPGGLAIHLAVDHLAEIPDAAAFHQSHTSPPSRASGRAPGDRISGDDRDVMNGSWTRATWWYSACRVMQRYFAAVSISSQRGSMVGPGRAMGSAVPTRFRRAG